MPNQVAELEGLSALTRLEERILATVEQLRAARQEKSQAQQEAAMVREQLAQSKERVRQLTAEIDSLRVERRRIGERLETLLAYIDLVVKE